jgi:hypothetical protein
MPSAYTTLQEIEMRTFRAKWGFGMKNRNLGREVGWLTHLTGREEVERATWAGFSNIDPFMQKVMSRLSFQERAVIH